MLRVQDSFTGGGGLDSHLADTGQSYRGTGIFAGGLTGSAFGVGCCSGNVREARINAAIYDFLDCGLDIMRGPNVVFLAMILRADAGNAGAGGDGNDRVYVWVRRLDALQAEVGFSQRDVAFNVVQGTDAPGTGLATVSWPDGGARRLLARVMGAALTVWVADAVTGANPVQLFTATLTQPNADAAHSYCGFAWTESGGATYDNLLMQDAAPPVTHLVAVPTALSFESYDEVQPAPQDVALTATGAPIVGLTVVQLDGDVPLALNLNNAVTPALLTVTPDVVGENLDPGVYPCHLRLNGTNAAEPLDVLVVVQVDSPWIEGRPDASASSWQAVP